MPILGRSSLAQSFFAEVDFAVLAMKFVLVLWLELILQSVVVAVVVVAAAAVAVVAVAVVVVVVNVVVFLFVNRKNSVQMYLQEVAPEILCFADSEYDTRNNFDSHFKNNNQIKNMIFGLSIYFYLKKKKKRKESIVKTLI